jgi:hypothetical protein
VAADLAAARKSLEQAQLIQKPTPGDKDVRDAVRDSITDQLGVLQKIIVVGAWEGVTKEDVPEGVIAAFKSARSGRSLRLRSRRNGVPLPKMRRPPSIVTALKTY